MTRGKIVLDFDVGEFCRNLKNSKQPPYQCPVADCLKHYRTICGLQYHLNNYDHNNPTSVVSPQRSHKKKGRAGNKAIGKTQELLQPVVREALTYAEAQKVVEFEVEARVIRVGISDPISVVAKEDYEEKYGLSDAKEGKPIQRLDPMKPDELKIKLPEPSFTILENYNIADAPPRPTNAYIRFIERSADELDVEVEYDMDEEDNAWLTIMNESRAEAGLPSVPVDTFELLMDRLEKESYFQMANSKSTECSSSDDDAVCCICMDGECQNSNVILFCDMCNLAVHQDCYGVPYIPEGQWLCRRCLQSPSRAVDCLLCPNTGGAFKQTDRGNWAHVVCALWIPEVRFANTVFLEPIDSIETIPPARWKLTCYICKQRGVGACIQCHKTNCYAAFHVTCAQQAGLYMKMDTVKDNLSVANGEAAPIMVQKTAFCDAHTPADAENRPRIPPSPTKAEGKLKMKKARRILAKNRSTVPVISIPTIPPDRIQEIGALVSIPKKSNFIQRLVAYWTLKRQFRNGVPLLRRLQTSHLARRDDSKFITELGEFYKQVKYLQCLRQDLEKARLLCELVRKREKKKNELIRAEEACLLVKLCPLQYFLTRMWEQIAARDTNSIFMEPVDTVEVPDYTEVVKHPMDLSTMKAKIDDMKYLSIAEFEADFNLMIANCLAYNSKDTIFYRAGLRMKEQGLVIIGSAQKEAQEAGIELVPSHNKELSMELNSQTDETVESHDDIETELAALAAADTMSLDEQMEKLKALNDIAQRIKNPVSRNKKCRLIKLDIAKLKRRISKSLKPTVEDKTSLKDSTPEKSQAEFSNEKKKSLTASGAESSGDSTDGDTTSSEDKPLKPSQTPQLAARKKQVRCASSGGDAKALPSENSPAGGGVPVEKRLQVTPSKSVTSSESSVASPSGVNRRNAVLFTRKAQAAAFKKPVPPLEISSAGSSNIGLKKRRVGRPRRNLNAALSDAESASPAKDFPVPCSDSFRVYRSGGEIPQETDEETQSESSSCNTSCSSCSSSSDGGQGDGSSSDEEGSEMTPDISHETVLEPLTLVWAKCRGYPWYPALIINPKMPRDYTHNGVPIPFPPADVMALANSYTEPVHLVLFFDAKRTWQWLPRNKLELLGAPEVDESKLTESRKPTDRKAVRKAYQEALLHRSKVNNNQMPESADLS